MHLVWIIGLDIDSMSGASAQGYAQHNVVHIRTSNWILVSTTSAEVYFRPRLSLAEEQWEQLRSRFLKRKIDFNK